jgi:hypothetical protein
MKKLAAAFSVLFALAAVCLAQTQAPAPRRTITNKDFEQYRKDRVTAEREYQKTYSTQGQLSPQEIQAINDARAKDLIDMANKIRAEDIERQKAAAMANPPAPQPIVITVHTTPTYQTPQIWSYGYPYGYPYGYYPRIYRYGAGGVTSSNPPLSRGTIYPR